MKRTTSLLALVCAAALLESGPASAAAAAAATNAPAAPKPLNPADLFPDLVVAKGKGFEIKRSQLEGEVIRFKAQAATHGQQVTSDQVALWEPRLLEELLRLQLLRGQATEEDKAAARKLADQRMDEAKAQLGSTEALDRQIKAISMTREELLGKWIDAATAENVLKRELKVTVTDDDIKKEYTSHPSQFEQPEMVRASHILLMTVDPNSPTRAELTKEQKDAKRKKMEDLLKRARAGEDFAKLAKEYSEDPGSKDKGGEYTFPHGQMVPEFDAAAFSLKTNQVSEIITTQYGYHIIKLSEKSPARTATLDDEVFFLPPNGQVVVKKFWIGAPEIARSAAKLSLLIRQRLEAIQRQAALPAYMDKLRKDADVQILDEKLKPKENPAALPPGHPPVSPGAKPAAK